MKNKLIKGALQLFELVKRIYGSNSKSIIIQQADEISITQECIEILKTFELPRGPQNAGASILKEAAETTYKTCGNGAATTIILAGNILKNAEKLLAAGVNSRNLERQINEASDEVFKQVLKSSIPISNREEISGIVTKILKGDLESCNLAMKAIEKVGIDNKIFIEASKNVDSSLEFSKGFYWPCELVNCHDLKKEKVLLNPLILILQQPLTSSKEMAQIIKVARSSQKPLAIFGELKEGALRTFNININVNMIVQALNVKHNCTIDEVIDLSIFTNCRTNFNFFIENLGTAEKIIFRPKEAIIVGGLGDKKEIERRIQYLEKSLKQVKNKKTKDELLDRISRLSKKACKILVGGFSELEIDEKIRKIGSALDAVRSCMEEGIVLGFGKALYNCKLDEKDYGHFLINKALKSLTQQLLENSSLENSELLEEDNLGYDLESRKIVDLRREKIYDSTKVILNAFSNAVSASKMLILSSFYICKSMKDIEVKQEFVNGKKLAN